MTYLSIFYKPSLMVWAFTMCFGSTAWAGQFDKHTTPSSHERGISSDLILEGVYDGQFGAGLGITGSLGRADAGIAGTASILEDTQSGTLVGSIRVGSQAIVSTYLSARQERASATFSQSLFGARRLHGGQTGMVVDYFPASGAVKQLIMRIDAGRSGDRHLYSTSQTQVNNYVVDTSNSIEQWQRISTTTIHDDYKGARWLGGSIGAQLQWGRSTEITGLVGWQEYRYRDLMHTSKRQWIGHLDLTHTINARNQVGFGYTRLNESDLFGMSYEHLLSPSSSWGISLSKALDGYSNPMQAKLYYRWVLGGQSLAFHPKDSQPIADARVSAMNIAKSPATHVPTLALAGKLERTVSVESQDTRTGLTLKDLSAPVITLKGAATLTLAKGSAYSELGFSCFDDLDGDCTAGVVVSGQVNADVVGTYTLNYRYTDSSGKVASAIRVVTIVAAQPSVIVPLAPISQLTLEWADTPEEQAMGLMNRTTLAENAGMMFVYTSPKIQCFWMYNTPIPLSIGFINPQGNLIQIEHMQPNSTRRYCSSQPILYALEVNQGWFERNNVTLNTQLVDRQ